MGQDSLPSGNSKPSSRSRPQKKQRGPKKPKKITPEYLHNSGLYYLERFSSSSANFRAVMLRKAQKSCYAWPEQDFDACTRMVDELVQKFIRLELLNDALYTRSKIYSLRRAGKSRRFIFSSLGVKGLEKNMIEKALAAYDAEHGLESSEKDAALTFARKKKIGPFRGTKEKNPQKELSAMARAGFSYDLAKAIVDVDEEF